MKTFSFFSGEVAAGHAWSVQSCRAQIRAILTALNALPSAPAPLLIKGNFAGGAMGPGGQGTDLRLLSALIQVLREAGYDDIVVGDALPGDRTDIYPLLRLDRMAVKLGFDLADFTHAPTQKVNLASGEFQICRGALERHIILLPSVAVDRVFGLSAALASMIGFIPPHQHKALRAAPVRNLLALYLRLNPALTVADCLVVQEGVEPEKSLSPRRFEHVIASRNALLADLFLTRIFGMTAEEVPILWRAVDDGLIDGQTFSELEQRIQIVQALLKPMRPLSDLRVISKTLATPKRLAFSLMPKRRKLAAPTGRLLPMDSIQRLERRAQACGECRRCESFCPVGLKREEIGQTPPADACFECLYCYMVCPEEALRVGGELGPLSDIFQGNKAFWEQL